MGIFLYQPFNYIDNSEGAENMDLNQWYKKGMDPDQYIESMNKHKDDLLHIYDHFKLPGDYDFFEEISSKKLRAIVLTEDWCGDAMLNIPILLRLSQNSAIGVTFLYRDKNLQLMDQYLTNGKSRSIPIFIFIDENGKEVAKWGPRAPELQEFIDQSMKELPDKDADDHEEKKQEALTFITKSFRDNQDFWTDVYQSIKQTLQRI